MLRALYEPPVFFWRGRLFPLGLSHWSQVQGSMNHSEAGWQPGDQLDAALNGQAASGAGKPQIRSREPRLEHL